MNIVTNFAKETLARLKGDDAGVIAAKNERKANSAINGQLASLRAKLVDDETAVEDAQEALKDAQFPKSLITDNANYVRGIKNAYERLQQATDTLESTKTSIAYFESVLQEFGKSAE